MIAQMIPGIGCQRRNDIEVICTLGSETQFLISLYLKQSHDCMGPAVRQAQYVATPVQTEFPR
jgi:hypothetical protein